MLDYIDERTSRRTAIRKQRATNIERLRSKIAYVRIIRITVGTSNVLSQLTRYFTDEDRIMESRKWKWKQEMWPTAERVRLLIM